jgi:hypothetical protein
MTRARVWPVLIVALLGFCAAWLWQATQVGATPQDVPTGATPPPLPAASPPAAVQAEAPAPTEPEQDPNTATVIFATHPAATATVTWGRKLLGRIKPGRPLVVKRPRDSGPLDVMVRAVGYMPVQTRAHTFSDTRVIVKLTRPENALELWGYRAPVITDAGVASPEDLAAQNAMAPALPGAPVPGAPVQAAPAPVSPAPVSPAPVSPAPVSPAPAPPSQ